MSQLALFTTPSPRRSPERWSVTRMLWEAGGRQTTTGKDRERDDVPHSGPCWWCGEPAPGRARPRSVLPKTFPMPLEAAAPDSEHLCVCCGWTLCDRVTLPASYARERLRMKATTGRRQVLSVRGADVERWLILELDDGRVGLWTCGPNVAAEKPWTERLAELRAEPHDVGPCVFTEAVDYADLTLGPVEKFRSYHHLATRSGTWWVGTDSDRMDIRAWLLDPPDEPWCGVIGDGKKHHAITAQMLDAVAEPGRACVYFQGAVVRYEPADLARQIEAAEQLIIAGASDEELLSGDYRPRGSLLLPLRQHEPHLSHIRGGPALPLVLYLRRNLKELAA